MLIAINNNKNVTKLSISININNNKYYNKRRNIIETKILKNFEYYSILFAEKIKNFVKQKTKLNTRFCKKYKTHYIVCSKISANFLTIQKNKKDLVYKKKTLHKKRALIEQEIENQTTIIIIYRQYTNVVDVCRQQIYNKLLQKKNLKSRLLQKKLRKQIIN